MSGATTKIKVKDHIAEYMIAKYGTDFQNPVKIPDRMQLYHLILDLLATRPANRQLDIGNLSLVLPNSRIGKSPLRYNYLSKKSVQLLESKMEQMFWADLHDYLDEKKHRDGISYAEAIYCWQQKYQINGISDDALKKSYYRWREKTRKKSTKRSYKKAKNQ